MIARTLKALWTVQLAAICILATIHTPSSGAISQAQKASVEDAAKQAELQSFELIWTTLRDRYWDQKMGGLDWQAVHVQYRQEVEAAKNPAQARAAMVRMIALLRSSHLAIIPAFAYSRTRSSGGDSSGEEQVPEFLAEHDSGTNEDHSGSVGLSITEIDGNAVVESVPEDSTAFRAGVRPGWIIHEIDGKNPADLITLLKAQQQLTPELLISEVAREWLSGPLGSTSDISFLTGEGTSVTRQIERGPAAGDLVSFGNLPPQRVMIEHRKLTSGVGYIRLNLFLNPMKVMPEIQKAVEEFQDAPGIVLDLRNNPGGIAMMAMGIAGWFVPREGMRLGTMSMRDTKLDFVINPRMEAYKGRLAILVNGGSASTTEILAQGLRDLGCARIFGTRTAGAALPSSVIRLPDGDRFQYPEASYVSTKGRVLEGNGVVPDVVIAPTISALLEGHDLPLEAAVAWSGHR